MEFINKIELQGIVGAVSLNKVGNTSVARFSVCTENSYNANDGTAVIDTTWHSCTAWESDKNHISDIKKCAIVHLVGRLRASRFTSFDGSERLVYEVFVNNVSVIGQR